MNLQEELALIAKKYFDNDHEIIQIIENEPIEFDEIVRISGMEAGKLGSLLSLMEIKGIVNNMGNNTYVQA